MGTFFAKLLQEHSHITSGFATRHSHMHECSCKSFAKNVPIPKKPFSNTKTKSFTLNERISFLRFKIGRFSSQIPQLQLQFQNLLNHRPYTSLQSYIVLLPGGKGFYHLLLIQYRAGRKRVFPSGTNTIFCRFDIL